MKYESSDDVRLRLYHSVVAMEGMPVYVIDVHDKFSVEIHNLVTGKRSDVKIEQLDLDPSHLPLGYVQVDDETLVIASRKPSRRYKQGLTQENLHSVNVVSKTRRGEPRGARATFPLAVSNDALIRTMQGKFTPIGDAFQKVRSHSAKVQAFSKDWAVSEDAGDLCLLYRGEVVGFANDDKAILLPERAYLKESLALCLK